MRRKVCETILVDVVQVQNSFTEIAPDSVLLHVECVW